jgi:WD40 repeat protein
MKPLSLALFIVYIIFCNTAAAQHFAPYIPNGHQSSVNFLQFDSTGDYLFSRDKNNKIILWDLFGRKEMYSAFGSVSQILVNFPTLVPSGSESDEESDTRVYNDAAYKIAKGGSQIICTKLHKQVYIITRIILPFTDIRINADGSRIAHICGDKYLITRETSHLPEYSELSFDIKVTRICFHPKYSYLLIAGLDDGSIHVIDLRFNRTSFVLKNDILRTNWVEEILGSQKLLLQSASGSVLFDCFENKATSLSASLGKNGQPERTITRSDGDIQTAIAWKNYALFFLSNDTVRKLKQYQSVKLNNTIFRPIAEFVPTLIDIPALVTYIAHFKSKFNESKITLSQQIISDGHSTRYYYHTNNYLHTANLKSRKNQKFLIKGTGNITYTANSKYAVGYRVPFYLTVVNLQTGHSNVFYDDAIVSLRLLDQSDTMVVQFARTFKVYKLEEKPKLLDTKDGIFINYSNRTGDLYYAVGKSLFILNLSNPSVQAHPLRAEYDLVSVVPVFKENSHKGYMLFYSQGITDFVDNNFSTQVSYYFFENGEFIIFTNDNKFYVSSKSLLTKVIVTDGQRHTYTLDQFEAKFNRPDIVLGRLPFIDSLKLKSYQLANTIFNKELDIEPDKLQFEDFLLPEAKITDINSGITVTDTAHAYHFSFSTRDSFISAINILVNNIPLFGLKGLDINYKKVSTFDTTVNIHLLNGDNFIKPTCLDNKKRKNFIHTYYATAFYPAKPKIYFVGIAADTLAEEHILDFPEKDIHDLASLVRNRYGNNCEIHLVSKNQVTRNNISDTLALLLKSDINDQVIICFSGHGILDSNWRLFLATYDMKFSSPAESGFAYADMEDLIAKIPAQKRLLLLDACNTGAQTSEQSELYLNAFDLMQDQFTGQSQGNGTVVISAARTSAQERTGWKNGALTYCTLQALRDRKADANKDSYITLNEYKSYILRKITEITNSGQRPSVRKDNADEDWIIW